MVELEIHSRNKVVSRWWRPSTSVFLGRVETSNNEMVWHISRTKHFRQHEHFTKNSKIRWTTMWVDREISWNINRCHHTVTLRATKSQWTHKITMVFWSRMLGQWTHPTCVKGALPFGRRLWFFLHTSRDFQSHLSLWNLDTLFTWAGLGSEARFGWILLRKSMDQLRFFHGNSNPFPMVTYSVRNCDVFFWSRPPW